jgi:hypothetical protein
VIQVLKLEEYIAQRKQEDGLNEFDVKERSQNMRVCINYVFEYFIDYNDIAHAEGMTKLENEGVKLYHKQMDSYEQDVRDL